MNQAPLNTYEVNGLEKVTVTSWESSSATDSVSSNRANVLVVDSAVGLDSASQLEGVVSTPFTSSLADATKTPASRGVLLGLTNGDLVAFWQAGTESVGGLVYSTSGDRAVTWSSPVQVNSRTDIYPTAVVQRNTNDIHLCYSMDEASPTLATTRSVFYRRFISTGSAGNPAFTVGSELSIMAGSASVAYERASIDIDSNNVPFVVAVRNTATGNTVACAIGVVSGNLAGANVDVDVTGVSIASPDVSLATTHIGSNWFMGINSGGTFWLTKATGPNVGLSSITFSAVTSISANPVHTIAIVGDTPSNEVHLGYINGTNGYVATWSDTSATLATPILVITNAQRIALGHDATSTWLFFIQRISAKQVAGYARETTGWATATVANSSVETWDWPNAVLRIDDAQMSAFVWSTSGLVPNKIYLSANKNVTPKTVTETVTVTETIFNGRAAFDMSTVLDAARIGVLAQDQSTPVDSASKAINPKVSDTATATELLALRLLRTETATAADVARIGQRAADTGTGTDVGAPKVVKTAADSASGAETFKFGPKVSESVTALDAVSALAFRITDSVTYTEAVNIRLVLFEAAPAGETYNLNMRLTDTATALDEIPARIISLMESVTVTELIGSARIVSDSVTATDVAKLEWNLSDFLTAIDTVTMTPRAYSSLVRLLVSNSNIKLRVEN